MTAISPSDRERYRDLIEIAQRSGGLWIAESSDLVLLLPSVDDEMLLLVWPTAEAARATISAWPEYAQFEPVYRPLERWLSVSTPHLIEDGVMIAAYPDERLHCLKVPAKSFARDLSAAPALQGKDISRLKRNVANRRPSKEEG